ncbi:hypothetical protein JD542_18510 [Aeromonas dhakensis]|uniref:hypothetical protein n=1 Tax=Aeromonas dhakensis TaxID=196024 RepID=UPI00191F556C|nr:hypothetical protein [Aeromonas dhakensis]MBL0603828.1 hypothetical protein [Aeromonas dhakensis]
MAIHGWGTPVSIYEIAVELGIGATGLSLNDSRVRTLLGNPSGAVYMSNAYGKSNGMQLTIGQYNDSGRLHLGFRSGICGGLNPASSDYGVVTQLYILRWSQYDNKIIITTNSGRVDDFNITFTLAGQTFTYPVSSNDARSAQPIPNAMSDLFLANVGKVCQVKFS